MDKPERCADCKAEWYGSSREDGRSLCAIHLATDGAFPSDEYRSKQRAEFRARMEQAIVEQIHARIRGD